MMKTCFSNPLLKGTLFGNDEDLLTETINILLLLVHDYLKIEGVVRSIYPYYISPYCSAMFSPKGILMIGPNL